MTQKHINSKHLNGTVSLNKNTLADIADLIRISPVACRTFLLIIAYSDDSNSVITDVATIAKMLGISKESAKGAMKVLIQNGYIEASEVQLEHEHDIEGVVHDKRLYRKSKKEVWKVIGKKLVTKLHINGIYNRFYVNENIAKCGDNGQEGNFIKHLSGNLFYDSRVHESEIMWEM